MTATDAWVDVVRATNTLCPRPIEAGRLLELAKAYGDARAEEASAAHRFRERVEHLQRRGADL